MESYHRSASQFEREPTMHAGGQVEYSPPVKTTTYSTIGGHTTVLVQKSLSQRASPLAARPMVLPPGFAIPPPSFGKSYCARGHGFTVYGENGDSLCSQSIIAPSVVTPRHVTTVVTPGRHSPHRKWCSMTAKRDESSRRMSTASASSSSNMDPEIIEPLAMPSPREPITSTTPESRSASNGSASPCVQSTSSRAGSVAAPSMAAQSSIQDLSTHQPPQTKKRLGWFSCRGTGNANIDEPSSLSDVSNLDHQEEMQNIEATPDGFATPDIILETPRIIETPRITAQQ